MSLCSVLAGQHARQCGRSAHALTKEFMNNRKLSKLIEIHGTKMQVCETWKNEKHNATPTDKWNSHRDGHCAIFQLIVSICASLLVLLVSVFCLPAYSYHKGNLFTVCEYWCERKQQQRTSFYAAWNVCWTNNGGETRRASKQFKNSPALLHCGISCRCCVTLRC